MTSSIARMHEPPQPLEPGYGERMTNAEAVLLCRFAKACCPQQQFDAYTPDAWFELLKDLLFDDCKSALTEIVKRQPFVAPAEIREEVTRVRTKRISDFGVLPEPSRLDPDSPTFNEDYRRFMGETMRAIGDGALRPGGDPLAHLASRDVIDELGQAGQDVPDA